MPGRWRRDREDHGRATGAGRSTRTGESPSTPAPSGATRDGSSSWAASRSTNPTDRRRGSALKTERLASHTHPDVLGALPLQVGLFSFVNCGRSHLRPAGWWIEHDPRPSRWQVVSEPFSDEAWYVIIRGSVIAKQSQLTSRGRQRVSGHETHGMFLVVVYLSHLSVDDDGIGTGPEHDFPSRRRRDEPRVLENSSVIDRESSV